MTSPHRAAHDPGTSYDARPIRLYGTVFTLGVAFGGVLLAGTDEDSSPVDQTVENWVHAGLAAAALAALALALRRDRRAAAAFLRRPLTRAGWTAWVDALRWRRRPYLLRPVAFLAALVTVFLPFRAGVQVLAGLDPDFTVDGWGGPSYLGAAAAHWLDVVLLLLAATALLSAGHGPRSYAPELIVTESKRSLGA